MAAFDGVVKEFGGEIGAEAETPEEYDTSQELDVLGIGYVCISEAKLLEILLSTETVAKRKAQVEKELTKLSKYTKEFKRTKPLKSLLHPAITAEANSLLLHA